MCIFLIYSYLPYCCVFRCQDFKYFFFEEQTQRATTKKSYYAINGRYGDGKIWQNSMKSCLCIFLIAFFIGTYVATRNNMVNVSVCVCVCAFCVVNSIGALKRIIRPNIRLFETVSLQPIEMDRD